MDIKFEIKLTVGETIIEDEHLFTMICDNGCMKLAMIKVALERFYRITKNKLLEAIR